MCFKRWVTVGDSQGWGRTFHTEETVWAEDKGEIQQLAYVHAHRYVSVYPQGSKSRGGLGR